MDIKFLKAVADSYKSKDNQGQKEMFNAIMSGEKQAEDYINKGDVKTEREIIKAPDSCREEFGADLDGCSTQENEGCGRCHLAIHTTEEITLEMMDRLISNMEKTSLCHCSTEDGIECGYCKTLKEQKAIREQVINEQEEPMNMYALKGHKVRVTESSATCGSDWDKDDLKKLEIGKDYEVEFTMIQGWSTQVKLKDIEGLFNVVNFVDAVYQSPEKDKEHNQWSQYN